MFLLFTCEYCTVIPVWIDYALQIKLMTVKDMQRGEEGNWRTCFASAHEGEKRGGRGERGGRSCWWRGVRAYSDQKNWRKRGIDNERERGWERLVPIILLRRGIVMEGLVPMAIAPSMCVCVCVWTDCSWALRLYGDEVGWGHSEPLSHQEPWNGGESQTDTVVYSPVLSASLITPHLPFFCHCMLAIMYRPWAFKASITNLVS